MKRKEVKKRLKANRSAMTAVLRAVEELSDRIERTQGNVTALAGATEGITGIVDAAIKHLEHTDREQEATLGHLKERVKRLEGTELDDATLQEWASFDLDSADSLDDVLQPFEHRITHHSEDSGCGCRSDMEELPGGGWYRRGAVQALIDGLTDQIDALTEESEAGLEALEALKAEM